MHDVSATNRGVERDILDFYETPEWCVGLIAPYLDLGSEQLAAVIDPGCGTGAIGRAITNAPPHVLGVEMHEGRAAMARGSGAYVSVHQGDFTEWSPGDDVMGHCLSVGNPPYAQAMAFLRHALRLGDACFLLRQGFMSSQKRRAWLKAHPFDLYVLAERPSFCWTLTWKTRCLVCDAKRKVFQRVAPGSPWPEDPEPPICCGRVPTITGRSRTTTDAADYGWLMFRHGGPKERGVVTL